jgi:F0F1-type ATP synthase assembly protein I
MTDQTPLRRDEPQSAASDGMNQGMRVLSSLVAGVLLYGGLGWVGDHFLGTRFLLPVGIVLGAAFGAYTSIRRLTTTLRSESPTPARGAQTSRANASEGGSR